MADLFGKYLVLPLFIHVLGSISGHVHVVYMYPGGRPLNEWLRTRVHKKRRKGSFFARTASSTSYAKKVWLSVSFAHKGCQNEPTASTFRVTFSPLPPLDLASGTLELYEVVPGTRNQNASKNDPVFRSLFISPIFNGQIHYLKRVCMGPLNIISTFTASMMLF